MTFIHGVLIRLLVTLRNENESKACIIDPLLMIFMDLKVWSPLGWFLANLEVGKLQWYFISSLDIYYDSQVLVINFVKGIQKVIFLLIRLALNFI